MSEKIKIIECPRDAMQGIKTWIKTEDKIRYINQLLKVGFDCLDCGSFVSEKAIPQMKDTAEVLRGLNLSNANSTLLTIVANLRGAESACAFDEVHYVGYPFSISETFQQRNTNASIAESLYRVEDIQNLVSRNNKELVVYISMGFGNPYGDPWSPEVAIEWCDKLHKELGVKILALSDTIGTANPEVITQLFSALIPALPDVEFGAHLHTRPEEYRLKIKAAYEAGCRRFDGAMKGYGGCPMATDTLTGNMPTESMLSYFEEIGCKTGINQTEFMKSLLMAGEIYPEA
jgi:hydroxymethylglutaryl-CoA lyase